MRWRVRRLCSPEQLSGVVASTARTIAERAFGVGTLQGVLNLTLYQGAPGMADIPVTVWQLVRDEDGHDVILLRDADGRLLPIVIGICEAAAIWVCLAPELAKTYLRRPWSHDLMQALLERLGARLERVVIDDCANGTFFATLHVRYREEEIIVDARPSDAIALLLRMPAPILVNAEIMDAASFYPEPNDDEDDGPEFGEEVL